VLEFVGSESFAESKIRIAESEDCDDVLLYVVGRPPDFEAEGLSDDLQKCQNGKFRITPNCRKLFCNIENDVYRTLRYFYKK
jgi:hypothetical protein